MRRALAAVGAVGALMMALWFVLRAPRPAEPARSVVVGGGGSQPAAPTRAGPGSETTTTLSPPPWARIGEDASTKAGYWAQLSDPARSDLGPGVAAETSRLGAALVRADATGEGRDAFYGYWGTGRAQPCCTNAVVHAAGASSTAHPDVVQVAVIWSATRLDGGPAVTEQTTVVYFARRGTQWVPVHSWELPA